MNSSLIDPNNHAPEVMPDDDWGDAAGVFPAGKSSAVSLPPRRSGSTHPGHEADATAERVGLRIEPSVGRLESPETVEPRRLEVQEINGSVVRLEAAAAASPPKVARQVTFRERPPRVDPVVESGGEGRQWGKSRGRPAGRWILAAGAGVSAVVVGGLLLLPLINATNAPRAVNVTFAPVSEEKIAGVEALNVLLTKQSEAAQVYHSYATAREVDELLPIVRDGEALRDVLRSRWKPSGIPSEWSPDAATTWSVVLLANRACGVLEGNLPDQSKFRAVFTYDHGRLLLDWMATTGHSTADFSDLQAGNGDPAEVRGKLGPAEFFSATFPEAEFHSYRLISPGGEHSVWCYTRRGTPADAALAPWFEKGLIIGEAATSRRVTLQLERGPDGSLPNQWVVANLLHEDWVKP